MNILEYELEIMSATKAYEQEIEEAHGKFVSRIVAARLNFTGEMERNKSIEEQEIKR